MRKEQGRARRREGEGEQGSKGAREEQGEREAVKAAGWAGRSRRQDQGAGGREGGGSEETPDSWGCGAVIKPASTDIVTIVTQSSHFTQAACQAAGRTYHL